MKRGSILIILIILAISFFAYGELTGKVTSQQNMEIGGPEFIGPTQEQINCMQTCSGCVYGDAECFAQNPTNCNDECGVETSGPPAPANEDEECMQKCVSKDCDEYDFMCERQNMNSCEEECNMKGDAPDESEMEEEQICISECVTKVDPSIICSSGNYEGEGETGNSVCQECAKSCEHLYSGPCLTDEKWEEIENNCMAKGEHMEAKPVMGDSGQGWECTINLECLDRSDEFGDDPGEGPGIINSVGNVFKGIGNFFKNIFSKSDGELKESETLK